MKYRITEEISQTTLKQIVQYSVCFEAWPIRMTSGKNVTDYTCSR